MFLLTQRNRSYLAKKERLVKEARAKNFINLILILASCFHSKKRAYPIQKRWFFLVSVASFIKKKIAELPQSGQCCQPTQNFARSSLGFRLVYFTKSIISLSDIFYLKLIELFFQSRDWSKNMKFCAKTDTVHAQRSYLTVARFSIVLWRSAFMEYDCHIFSKYLVFLKNLVFQSKYLVFRSKSLNFEWNTKYFESNILKY